MPQNVGKRPQMFPSRIPGNLHFGAGRELQPIKVIIWIQCLVISCYHIIIVYNLYIIMLWRLFHDAQRSMSIILHKRRSESTQAIAQLITIGSALCLQMKCFRVVVNESLAPLAPTHTGFLFTYLILSQFMTFFLTVVNSNAVWCLEICQIFPSCKYRISTWEGL